MTTTLETLQSGSCTVGWIALIEGCKFVLSDKPQAAVQVALAGTDWSAATVINGLFVELNNQQSLELWNPWTTQGSCKLRVIDTDGLDTFATYINKRLSGAETVLTATVDRNDTTLNVAGTTNFTASGEAHIGTECFSYSSLGATSFTISRRGKYSPFGTAVAGADPTHFANHHRKGQDSTHTNLLPLVTQLPRRWLGRRVGVWMCTWNEATQTLSTRANSQLVYAGRISGLAEDPQTFHTVIDLKHIGDTDIKDATIGRDFLSATLTEGLYMVEGRSFGFFDWQSTTKRTANRLDVVSGAPASANEMQAGYYTVGELCEKLSGWLATELGAGRLFGHYTWNSPVTSNVGLRTKCYWKSENAGTVNCSWSLDLPGEVAAFLGLVDTDDDQRGQQTKWPKNNAIGYSNNEYRVQGDGVPYANMTFQPLSPGRLSQEFTDSLTYQLEDIKGAFIDNYDWLPWSIQKSCDSSLEWGLFLFDEKTLVVASHSSGVLSNCWISPFQFSSFDGGEALTFIGRRLDQPDSGPTTIRQVFVMERDFVTMFLNIAYSTGTPTYNHSTFDTLPFGFGWNMPGSLLGPEFERSIYNLPGAHNPLVFWIDESTKFSDLIGDDLLIRWAFLRWRDQGFELAQWKTPLTSLAAESYTGDPLTLTEANKAESPGSAGDHRSAAAETDEHIRPIVKIDYARDLSSDRSAKYLKSIQVEDQRACDDAGGGLRPFTLKMRNTFASFMATGEPVEALIKEFIARIPMASKAGSKIVRTIDMRYWEGYGVGDIAIVSDNYARDPITGTREIAARPAMITRLSYSPGGPTAKGTTREMYGEIELMFLDVQRGKTYAPAAQIDDTQANAGYNAGGPTLTCYAHKYSHSFIGLEDRRGGTFDDDEAADASHFPAGSEIYIIEMDPANPAAPTAWERTVLSQTGNTITLTATLSAPAWDTAKKYRIVPRKYSQVVTAQKDVAYQADDTDEMVEDLEPPWHYSAGAEPVTHSLVAGTEKAEFLPDLSRGDGRPYDVAYDHVAAYGLNGFINYKSAHQAPFMSETAVRSGTFLGGYGYGVWDTLHIIPYFLGTSQGSTNVRRTLTLAPHWRAATATNSWLRVTIGRAFPTHGAGVEPGLDGMYGPKFVSEFNQTAEWGPVSSTTWNDDTEKTLEINCKDLHFGYVWLVVEGGGDAQSRGLYKLIEGPRVVG